MNHESTPEQKGRHARTTPSLEELGLGTDDQLLRERWDEGLARWGSAFVAYTRLQEPALYRHDVLAAFQDVYLASYPNSATCVSEQLDALGWSRARDQLLSAESIPDDVLIFDQAAMLKHMRDVYSLVQEGEEIHVFAR